jgi:hypothetical protein
MPFPPVVPATACSLRSTSMHAVVVPKPDMQAIEEEWRTYCRALNAGYMYPKTV